MTRNNFLFLLLVLLIVKITLFFAGAIAFTNLPYSTAGYQQNFHFPVKEPKNITAFKTWDAQHYLFLSKYGYAKGNESNRFFPLYPLLIFLLSKPGIPNLLSSYFLSNVFSFGCVILLFLLTKRIFKKEDTAFSSVILFLSFPSAFFLSLPYTESLFIFLVMLFFWFLETNKKTHAFLISFFLPLARPTGIFIEAPIFIYSLYEKNKKNFSIPTFNKRFILKFNLTFLGMLFPLFGLIVYFLIMKYFLGNYFVGIQGQSSVASWNIANVFDPFSLLKNLVSPPFVFHSFQHSILDRMFFIFFLSMLPLVYKNVPRHYFYYTLATGLVPLFGSFTSYIRYLLPAFPVFMVLSYYLQGKLKSIFYLTLFVFSVLQAVLFVMHILNYWAA